MKTLHVPCYSKSKPLPVLKEHTQKLDSFTSVGVLSTSQHLNALHEIEAFLQKKGKRIKVGGQILGCNQKNALRIEKDVECFIYVGSGRFHPLGVALKTSKPVFILNPLSGVFDSVSDEEKESWRKKQRARISKAFNSKNFGILLSTKDGQLRLKEAENIKRRIEKNGRKAFIFAGEELSPQNILPFKVDCWINTACPRITDDEYEKPVLNTGELDYLCI